MHGSASNMHVACIRFRIGNVHHFLFATCYRRFLDVKGYADDLESTFKSLLEIRQVGATMDRFRTVRYMVIIVGMGRGAFFS